MGGRGSRAGVACRLGKGEGRVGGRLGCLSGSVAEGFAKVAMLATPVGEELPMLRVLRLAGIGGRGVGIRCWGRGGRGWGYQPKRFCDRKCKGVQV